MKQILSTLLTCIVLGIGGLPLWGQTANVQVIHNSADPAAAVVDIYVQFDHEEVKLDDVAFRTATPFLELPSGVPITIVIAPSESQSSDEQIKVFSDIKLKHGEDYHIIANGVLSPDDFAGNPDHKKTAFNLFILPDARMKSVRRGGNRVDIRAFHGVTDAPNVGVNLNGSVLIGGFSYRDLTHYGSIRAQSYRLDVTPGHQPNTILFSYEADLSGLGGEAALIVASGFLSPSDNQEGADFALLAILPDGTVITLPTFEEEAKVAKVQVIHNAADPAAEVVDIYVQFNHEEVKLDDVAFRTATPFIELPSDVNINVIISPADSRNSHDRIKAFHDIRLEAGESYHLIANGLLSHDGFSGNPDHRKIEFDLFLFKNAREESVDGESVDVRIFHGATDAPEVGVNANGGTIVPGFSYGDLTEYLSIPADSYRLDITPGQTPEEILLSYLADVKELAGGAAIILASGFLDPSKNNHGEGFALIAVLPDGTVILFPEFKEDEPEPKTARVQVIHNSADPVAEVVDIYVDTGSDIIKLEDVAFRTATPFLDLPAEQDLEIIIAGPNSEGIDEGIASFDAILAEGESYHIVATGVLSPEAFAPNPDNIPTAFTLLVLQSAREAATENDAVDIKVLHSVTDAPTVGVNANGANIVPSLQYTEHTEYLSIPADFYQLDVTLAGQMEAIVASFDADLEGLAGGAALVIASGFLDPSANPSENPLGLISKGFGLIAVLPDGTVILLPETVTTTPATARVQVIHNAADTAAEIVDIYVDTGIDTIKIDNFAFRTATPFLDLPAGVELTIVIAGPNSQDLGEGIASFSATLEEDEAYYVVANGVLEPEGFAVNPDEISTAFTLLIEPGAREVAEDGASVDLKVLHGATDAPNVGVNANGATIIPGFSYTEFTDYLSVPADFYQFDITLGGEPEAIVASFDGDISGLGGGAALVIASGFLAPEANQEGKAFGLIAVLADGTVITLPETGSASARVQVIHNAADPAASVVDIYVNTGQDTIKIDDFTFRTATPFLDLPANIELNIVIAGPNSQGIEEGIASFAATLDEGESYYVVANGVLEPDSFATNPDGISTAFTLLVESGAREAAEDGASVDLKVLHGATDAPNVGVNANGATVIPGFSYTEFTDYLSVPADFYQFDITLGGEPEAIVASFDGDISGLGGGAALVLASGFLSSDANQTGEAFGLLAVLPDGSVILLPATVPPSARVQVIHNAADPAAALVDIYVNTGVDIIKIDDFAFRSATPFIDLPAETALTIVIAGPASESIEEGIASFPATLEEGESYYVVANGVLEPDSFAANPDGISTAFTLLVEPGAREVSDDGQSVDLKVLHGATDAPNVGVNANGATLIPGFSYTEFQGYLPVPADNYLLDITPGGDPNTTLLSYNADLNGLGGVATLVIASGFLDTTVNQSGPTFGLIAVLPDGNVVLLPEPGASGAQIIHNSADPALSMVDIYIEGGAELQKIEDLVFQEATPFLDLPSDVDLTLYFANSQSESLAEAVANFSLRLESGKNYYLVANGVLNPNEFSGNPDGEDIGLSLFIDDEARRITAGLEVAIKLFHGVTDAPELNIFANSASSPLVRNLGYGEFSSYYELFPTAMEFSMSTVENPDELMSGFTSNMLDHSGKSGLILTSGFINTNENQLGMEMDLLFAQQDGSTAVLSSVTTNNKDLVLDNSAMSVFPNPIRGMAQVEYQLESREDVSFELIDMLGKRVLSTSFTNVSAGNHIWSLEANDLQTGIHTLIMRTEEKQAVSRIMIQN